MILYAMSQEALQRAKATLDNVWRRYYDCPSNDWMCEEWGHDAFMPFREVPDFTLALPNADVGEGATDILNCERVYSALRNHLRPFEAAQERLWAGICNYNFYEALRTRWKYDSADVNTVQHNGYIEGRFFFIRRSSRGSLFRNTISKCWWVSYHLYDAERPQDPFWRLHELGAQNFSTKVSDIFFNNRCALSPNVIHGIVSGIMSCRAEGIPIDTASDYLRPALQHLNAAGGLVVLDTLKEEDIRDILVEGAKRVVRDREEAI